MLDRLSCKVDPHVSGWCVHETEDRLLVPGRRPHRLAVVKPFGQPFRVQPLLSGCSALCWCGRRIRCRHRMDSGGTRFERCARGWSKRLGCKGPATKSAWTRLTRWLSEPTVRPVREVARLTSEHVAACWLAASILDLGHGGDDELPRSTTSMGELVPGRPGYGARTSEHAHVSVPFDAVKIHCGQRPSSSPSCAECPQPSQNGGYCESGSLYSSS